VSDSPETAGSPAVATAEPPAKPPAPPATGSATPGGSAPKRGWIGWTVGAVIVVLVIGGLVGVVVWSRSRGSGAAAYSSAATPFDSAMKKAGVKATFPPAPVDLVTLKAAGAHPFDATFTAQEVSALMNAFPHAVPVQGAEVALSRVTVTFPAPGTAGISGTVSMNSSSYSGFVTGPVEYASGGITSPGATEAQGEGMQLSAGQTQQVTGIVLAYLNGYLAAAPGFSVQSATVTADGVHVTGTAPDSLTLP
jgi:hypothetical protein